MLDKLAKEIHSVNGNNGFWDMEESVLDKMKTQQGFFKGAEIEAVQNAFKCQRLLLIISEVIEAMDTIRDPNNSEDTFDEELADILIRTLDVSRGYDIYLQDEVEKKLDKNKSRPPLHNKKF